MQLRRSIEIATAGVEEEEERAPQEKGKMLKASCLLSRFNPASRSVNIPLCDLERDFDIADVGEVGGQHRKTTIAADDELLSSDYERSDASL